MASPTLVPTSASNVNQGSNKTPMLSSSANISKGTNTPIDTVRHPAISSLESIGEHRITNKLSKQAADLHVQAWRPGTRASYKSAWKRWSGWCISKQVNPIQASLEDIIEFLTCLFYEQKQYRTINTYRSAISRGHNMIDNLQVGKHPTIITHMRAIFNVRTPLPRYQNSWDVDKVLNLIALWGDNSNMSLKLLSHKLVMLLSLASAGRASEINKLHLDYMCDKGDHVIFKIPSLTKTSKVGKPLPELRFTKLKDSSFCILDCLKTYIEVTAECRKSNDSINRRWLILSFVKPYHPITTSTLARWLKFTIHSAGIDSFLYKAHSTRAASTSKAFRNGISCSEILKQAKWTNVSTFSRFYNKPIEPNSFQQVVLTR